MVDCNLDSDYVSMEPSESHSSLASSLSINQRQKNKKANTDPVQRALSNMEGIKLSPTDVGGGSHSATTDVTRTKSKAYLQEEVPGRIRRRPEKQGKVYVYM